MPSKRRCKAVIEFETDAPLSVLRRPEAWGVPWETDGNPVVEALVEIKDWRPGNYYFTHLAKVVSVRECKVVGKCEEASKP